MWYISFAHAISPKDRLKYLIHFSAPDVKWQLIKQNDVPPNWKDTPTAPLLPAMPAIPACRNVSKNDQVSISHDTYVKTSTMKTLHTGFNAWCANMTDAVFMFLSHQNKNFDMP